MIFQAGQKVICIDPADRLVRGETYIVVRAKDTNVDVVDRNGNAVGGFYPRRFQLKPQSSLRTIMKDIITSIKGFISENKNVIYWTALAFLADHFFLKGAFRQRLEKIVEAVLSKVEAQIK